MPRQMSQKQSRWFQGGKGRPVIKPHESGRLRNREWRARKEDGRKQSKETGQQSPKEVVWGLGLAFLISVPLFVLVHHSAFTFLSSPLLHIFKSHQVELRFCFLPRPNWYSPPAQGTSWELYPHSSTVWEVLQVLSHWNINLNTEMCRNAQKWLPKNLRPWKNLLTIYKTLEPLAKGNESSFLLILSQFTAPEEPQWFLPHAMKDGL